MVTKGNSYSMGEYTSYDLQATLDIEGVKKENIEKVTAAWGEYGDYGEWMGGFLLTMKSGNYVYITGWCDTSGWGCQDGADASEFKSKPSLDELSTEYSRNQEQVQWDYDPADLNLWITGQTKGMDDL